MCVCVCAESHRADECRNALPPALRQLSPGLDVSPGCLTVCGLFLMKDVELMFDRSVVTVCDLTSDCFFSRAVID